MKVFFVRNRESGGNIKGKKRWEWDQIDMEIFPPKGAETYISNIRYVCTYNNLFFKFCYFFRAWADTAFVDALLHLLHTFFF